MIYYDRVKVSGGIDVNKKSASNECDICQYWYFLNYSFTFQPHFCNNCHDLLMMSVNFSNIAILNIKGSDYSCIISLISKNKAIKLSKNADLNNKNCKYFIGYFIDNHKLIQIKKQVVLRLLIINKYNAIKPFIAIQFIIL